jgi:hypothetical protein
MLLNADSGEILVQEIKRRLVSKTQAAPPPLRLLRPYLFTC